MVVWRGEGDGNLLVFGSTDRCSAIRRPYACFSDRQWIAVSYERLPEKKNIILSTITLSRRLIHGIDFRTPSISAPLSKMNECGNRRQVPPATCHSKSATTEKKSLTVSIYRSAIRSTSRARFNRVRPRGNRSSSWINQKEDNDAIYDSHQSE